MERIGTYSCDAGCLKIGAKGVSFLVNNNYGDGTFNIYRCTMKELPDDSHFEMAFQGVDMVLFDYDCKGGKPIEGITLTGSFLALSLDGDIYLEQYKTTPDNWGINL